jgi:hypothetical protein
MNHQVSESTPVSRRQNALLRRIRGLLVFFIVALTLSGLTAFPLEWEIDRVAQVLGISPSAPPESYDAVRNWVATVQQGIHDTAAAYPFMAYGTDWLAFAHLVIAVVFLGPLRNPVRNVWVIEFGMIACLGVIPLALICGPIRGIPFFHQLIDCSFGVLGLVPLWLCRRWTLELAAIQSNG